MPGPFFAMKRVIFLFLFFSFHTLAQDSTPQQAGFMRKTAIRKYIAFGPLTLASELLKNNKNYDEFIKKNITQDVPVLQKNSRNYCQQVCPNDLGILKINQRNYVQNEKNSLSFLNESSDFKGVMTREYGFCWGHSSLTNQLRHLAFFDPENSFESISFDKNSKEWKEYIKEALKDVFYSRPRVFPYLSSIRELSELFERDLKELVIEKWGQNAVSLSNYFKIYSNTKVYERDELRSMMSELSEKIARGETPEILFAIWDTKKWLHVVLIKEVVYNEFDYTYKLTLDDNKQYNNISEVMDASEIIVDLKDQSIIYKKGFEFGAGEIRVGRLELTETNTQMYNRILPRLVNFCKIKTGCIE